MPDPAPQEPLEWNELNLCLVLSDISARAIKDEEFNRRVLAAPLEVLQTMIQVPPEYQPRIMAKPTDMPALIFGVPPFDPDAAQDADEYKKQAAYSIICTISPW